MRIKHWMSPNPITVSEDTQVTAAHKIMAENRVRRLPVVDGEGRLKGLITLRNIIAASPSAAEALGRHEMNALMAKLKVGHIMVKNPETVSPEDSVMDVVRDGHVRGIGAFPVVEDGKLVGIVTETEIFRAMLHIFGAHQGNSIVVIENVDLENSLGEVSKIAALVEEIGVPVEAVFSLRQRRGVGHRVYLRAQTPDPAQVAARLTKAGYQVAK